MENKTLIQFFEWYLPENGLLWKRLIAQAKELANTGINMAWLPPAYKGAAGSKSVGYDVYDTYDLGEFDQKGGIPTKYGTKSEYLEAVNELKSQGIQVIADIVLNHMMGADSTEDIYADINHYHNRNEDIQKHQLIRAWTKFNFPGRNGKYSDFTWNYTHFSGTDWDELSKQKAIYNFEGKNWCHKTDNENINYDYLMGTDLDFDNPETVQAVINWGQWYFDTVKPDGVRLDAVKHISHEFYEEWIKKLREYTGKDFFAVAEYWSSDINKLIRYLDETCNCLSLFDVPLHFAFYKAATSNGNVDMGGIFNDTLVKLRPDNCVTFVDNHDTQPGQALCSYIPEWFKLHAYAIILLRQAGIPCVFYGDYYGIPHDNIKPLEGLKKLIFARKMYAYGDEHDYFDDASVVGFTREGISEKADSGVAVLLTDSLGGSKKMYVGLSNAGSRFYNILKNGTPVLIDSKGYGNFAVDGGSVGVWLTEAAYQKIYTDFE